jgi:hypothetical protein
MKYVITTLFFLFSVDQAAAVVSCAAGAYHAGCVRHYPVAHGAVVVEPHAVHCAVVNGRRVCR